MNAGRAATLAIVGFWIAGGCQAALAPRMVVWHAGPNFLLLMAAGLALFGRRSNGAVFGFIAGMVEGSIAGVNLSWYVLTRTLMGFVVGWLNEVGLEPNPVMAALVAAAATIGSQAMLMFVVHRGPLIPFLATTFLTAIVNAVFAVPLYYIIKPLIPARMR